MAYKMNGPSLYKGAPKLKEKSKKKTSEKTENQKAITNAIDEGLVPQPNTKEKLKQYGEAYFDEKSV